MVSKMQFAKLIIPFMLAACLPATAHAQGADSDLAPVPQSEAAYGTIDTAPDTSAAPTDVLPDSSAPVAGANAQAATEGPVATDGDVEQVFTQNEILSAAESVFGRGAEGLARMIETIFKDNGRPNAYIVGNEGGGAIGVGLRYGKGTLFHKVEGEMPIYWRGPSLGFDVGADANKTFTLVYKLYDTEDIFRPYPAVEGKVYVIGGLTAHYEQRGDIILVPIKLGVGWRLGVNAGYVRYSKERRLLPF